MKWKRIDKTATPQPATGLYGDWKPLLATESDSRCVYCSIRDQVLGGRRFFHVEHYRPKETFPEYENTYGNLFYACAVCNIFKGRHWIEHEDGDWESFHFPDPSKHDYAEIFEFEGISRLKGKNNASCYLVERLHLNRAHLIRERRIEIAYDSFRAVNAGMKVLSASLARAYANGDSNSVHLIIRLSALQQNLLELLAQKDSLPNYFVHELR